MYHFLFCMHIFDNGHENGMLHLSPYIMICLLVKLFYEGFRCTKLLENIAPFLTLHNVLHLVVRLFYKGFHCTQLLENIASFLTLYNAFVFASKTVL